MIYAGLAALYVYQIADTWRVNAGRHARRGRARDPPLQVPAGRRSSSLTYFVTFGSELAIVSIASALLQGHLRRCRLSVAGLVGASFGFTAFFARPAGGWLSDRFGRRKVLLVLL